MPIKSLQTQSRDPRKKFLQSSMPEISIEKARTQALPMREINRSAMSLSYAQDDIIPESDFEDIYRV